MPQMEGGRKKVRNNSDPKLASDHTMTMERTDRAGSTETSRVFSNANEFERDYAERSWGPLMYSKLSASLSSVPEIRLERVEPLRQAVQDGTYQVSNQQIANAFIGLIDCLPRQGIEYRENLKWQSKLAASMLPNHIENGTRRARSE